ncbi:MAG: FMN-binding protein [Planctomycetota bacterium]
MPASKGPQEPRGSEPATAAATAENGARLEFFADDTDPAIAAWLKALTAELRKRWPAEQLEIRVLNPDDKANYARLTAFERLADLKQFAAVEAFLVPQPRVVTPSPSPPAPPTPPPTPPAPEGTEALPPPAGHPLALVGREQITQHAQAAVAAILTPQKGLLSAAQPDLLLAAARKMVKANGTAYRLPADFPGPLDAHATGVVKRWRLESITPPGDEPSAAPELVLLYLPIDCPVCADTELLVEIDEANRRVAQIAAIRPIEKYGLPIPTEAKQFLARFLNLPLDRSLPERAAKIDGISGASKTSANVKRLVTELAPAGAP